MDQRTCSIDGCERKHYAKGWCQMHWRRVRSHGSTDYPRASKPCAVSGCESLLVAKGLCSKHYQRQERLGSTELVREVRYCSVEGCGRLHHAKGLCRRHREREIRTGDPEGSTRPVGCKVDGCKQDHYGVGYCARHFQRFKKYGVHPKIEDDQHKLYAPVKCQGCGSEERIDGRLMGYCSMNCYHRVRRGWDGTTEGTCPDCGSIFSYLELLPSGRVRKRDALRCEDCVAVWSGPWCMTTAEIAARDGGWVCAIGGEPIDRSTKWPDAGYPTVDHIIPRSRGGLDVPENVQLACWGHNRQKSNRMPSVAFSLYPAKGVVNEEFQGSTAESQSRWPG